MNRFRRTTAALALTAALVGMGAGAASAGTVTGKPVGKATAVVRTDPGVAKCIAALTVAHRKGGEAREDKAVRICGRSVTTERQADALYRWANRKANRWALDLIG